MTEQKVEKLTLEEFDQLVEAQQEAWRKKLDVSWQQQAMQDMEIGSAIRISHEGLGHERGIETCGFNLIRTRLHKMYSDRKFSIRHEKPTKTILVACRPK